MQQNQHDSLFNMNWGEFVCIEQMFQQNSAEKLLVRLRIRKIVIRPLSDANDDHWPICVFGKEWPLMVYRGPPLAEDRDRLLRQPWRGRREG